MDADAIVAAARRAARLDTFDSETFREGLELLCADVARSEAITDEGRQVLAGLAAGMLANRLRIADYARRNPHVLDQPVERPIFIFGMPRTGTTMLSHLLAVDPRRRSLLRWEVFDSVPPPTQDTLFTDPRCLAMLAADESAINSSPDMHVERADLPIECIVSQAADFRCILWAGMFDVPEYERWLLDVDMVPAYRFHQLQLKVLQAHSGRNWALKAPAHALSIDDLRAVYPDARLIWTHRDPYRAMGSVCSMTAASRRAFASVDDSTIGPRLAPIFAEHIARPMAVRARDGAGSIYDLHYADMLRDPIAAMGALYDWLGEPFTPEAQAAMRCWLAENPQGKFGRHVYDLERFGLSVEALRPRFADYVDRYGVAAEG